MLCDREPVGAGTDGRVALLGDAAHPMLQYMAQGACMAMEDAMALADQVAARPDDLPAALAADQQRMMAAKSSEAWYDAMAWLYGGNGREA